MPRKVGGAGVPLYVMFVDFRKAFDCVCRDLLWKRLESLEITGNMLQAIKGVYKTTSFQIRVGGEISEGCVVTVTGVKQGCSLSPDLFGLFIEELHEFLRIECPGIKVCVLDEVEFKELLYADDVTMVGLSHLELQQLSTALEKYSGVRLLDVNGEKSEWMEIKPARFTGSPPPPILHRGNIIKLSPEFKYLGLWVHESKWFYGAPQKLTDTATKAMWALIARIEGLGITCLRVKISLFLSQVCSIGNYACQVWGVEYLRLDSEAHIFNSPMQKLALTFLRMVCKVPQSVSRWVLLRECGIDPIQSFWARICARFWNRNQLPAATRLIRALLRKDVALFQSGSDTCWAAKFLTCMARIGLTNGKSQGELRLMSLDSICAMKFSEADIQKALDKVYDTFRGIGEGSPRTADRRGLAWVRNKVWFQSDKNLHLVMAAPPKHTSALMRFRLGCCSELRVHDHTIENRNNRYCTTCYLPAESRHANARGTKSQDDEFHMIFECVRFQGLRSSRRWASLFSGGTGDLKAFMNQEPQAKVAYFIYTLLEIKKRPESAVFINYGLDLFDSGITEAESSASSGSVDMEVEAQGMLPDPSAEDEPMPQAIVVPGTVQLADEPMPQIEVVEDAVVVQSASRKRRRSESESPCPRGTLPVRARFL